MLRRFLHCSLVLLALAGCDAPDATPSVVVYTSFDSVFAQAVFDDFTRQTGIRVLPVYDTEETKAVGLARRLIAERRAPQADVFWNGEVLRTCLLDAEGVLEPHAPASAADIGPAWKAGAWTGFGARARVIVSNTAHAPDPPRTLEALTDPRWKGKVAMANPHFGTTAAHVAALWSVWGPERTADFFRRLKANGVVIVGGNSHVRDLVARGEAWVGLCDTDDAWVGIDRGDPVAMTIPEPALLIPNTAALVRGAPHPTEARRFLEFLLDPAREEMMARSKARQMPVRPGVAVPDGVRRACDLDAMPVDWPAARQSSDAALKEVQSILGL